MHDKCCIPLEDYGAPHLRKGLRYYSRVMAAGIRKSFACIPLYEYLWQLLKRYEIKMETFCQASVNKTSKTCTIQPF